MSKRLKKKKKTKSKKIKHSVKNNSHNDEELVIKVSKHWSKKAYANKNSYQKKYNHSIKKNDDFGEKKEKELLGSNLIKKLKTLNSVQLM